jgi:PAS domain S-box-containing protein
LRNSEELHRVTLSNISDAVFITDDEGVFTYVCPNVAVIFGYERDEVRAMARIDRLFPWRKSPCRSMPQA